jgi:UvrD-like helicase C-terminal domain
VIRFRRGSVKLGIERGSYATVEVSDAGHDRLTVRTAPGAAVSYAPERLRGVEVFRPESRTVAAGDRIQFRTPNRALKVANGEFATVAAISGEQTRLRMDDGREIWAATPRLRHIDYGYASTSHSSQGATVDRVIVNLDTTRSVKLVNQRQFYVSISRARHDARIYTDDATALARAVGREQLKPTALEHLPPAQRPNSRNYKPVEIDDPAAARLKPGIRQHQKLDQSRGIRW